MSTWREPKSKFKPGDNLALDPETVKDLEPREQAGSVRGGRSSGGGSVVSGGPASSVVT